MGRGSRAGRRGGRAYMRTGRGILESEGDGSRRAGGREWGEDNRKMRKNMSSNPWSLAEVPVKVLLHKATKKKWGGARRNNSFIQASNPL